jgi:hypothetical protein
MMRSQQGTKYRAPSEVGSIHSFRSFRTTEEQVNALEERMERYEEAQKETNVKLDQVLALLAKNVAANAGSSDPAPTRKGGK